VSSKPLRLIHSNVLRKRTIRRKTIVRKLFIIVLILAWVTRAFSQADVDSRADALAHELIRTAHLPGLSITVFRDDSLVWSKGFGLADVSTKRYVTPATRFRIGSLTKLLTAVAAVRLAQDGLLDLDATVETYVPSFPNKGYTITTKLLLGHLSGIRQYGRNEYINTRHFKSIRDALTIFESDSLLFIPGTKYHYSSYGYVLAGAVIESASGSNFLHFLHDSLFVPLLLPSITPDYNDTSDTTQAKPYGLDSKNSWIEGPFNDNSNRWGAGGMLSTSVDLSHFGSILLTNEFLNAKMRRLMFTSQETSDGKETGVGFGWRIAKDSTGNIYFNHGGDSIGGRAFLLIYPRYKVVVSILANLTFAQIGQREALRFVELFSK
jgi:serine beta-lactamase-like protein LACTB, mitochondrial